MKKRNNNSNFFLLKKYLLCFICIILLILSYFEITGRFYITGYFKDIFFYSVHDWSGEEFINGINLELVEENKSLKNMISVSNSLSFFEPIYAVVIERNSSSWFDYLTINKGKIDGIEKGMAVVDSFGVVGIVEHVSLNNSVVSLITCNKKSNNISVKINVENPIYSILSFSNEGLVISNIDKSIYFDDDSFVFTSGLGNKFPSGLLIGKVSNIKNDVYNSSKMLFVDIAADINNLQFVAILKRGDNK